MAECDGFQEQIGDDSHDPEGTGMGVFHDFQPAFAGSTCTQGVHDVSQAIDMQSPGYPDRDNHGDGPGAGGPAMQAHKIEAENHERTNKHPDGREEREGASQAGRILSWYREKGQGTNSSNKWTHGVKSITPHTELKPKISFEAGAAGSFVWPLLGRSRRSWTLQLIHE